MLLYKTLPLRHHQHLIEKQNNLSYNMKSIHTANILKDEYMMKKTQKNRKLTKISTRIDYLDADQSFNTRCTKNPFTFLHSVLSGNYRCRWNYRRCKRSRRAILQHSHRLPPLPRSLSSSLIFRQIGTHHLRVCRI